MMQQVPLILSLTALSVGGYAVVTQPDSPTVETDDIRLKALQEEMAALRKDLYAIKDSSGGPPPPPPPMNENYGKGDSSLGSLEAPGPSIDMPPSMPENMPEMVADEDLPVDPMLEAQIRKIMREERQRYREKRVGKHLERFVERLKDRLADNELTSNLSEEDKTTLTEILHKERKSMSKLYRGIRSGDMSPKEARQELSALRADTVAIVRESMGDELAGVIGSLSPLPERGPLAPRRSAK